MSFIRVLFLCVCLFLPAISQPPQTRADKTDDVPCLFLNNDRFQVTVANISDPQSPIYGGGVRLDEETGFDETGYFHFGDSADADVVVRVFDGCDFNNNFWVFYASLTKVDYEITVTDTQTSLTKTYTNTLGTPFPPIQDTNAFATCPTPVASSRESVAGFFDGKFVQGSGMLVPFHNGSKDNHTISLFSDRFRVRTNWTIPGEGSGEGMPGLQTDRSGSFAFLDRSDQNVYFKIMDGRPFNGHFWFFFTSLTGAEYDLVVEDTETGMVKTYSNPLGESSFGADLLLDEPANSVVYPWISNNDDFQSTLTMFNGNCLPLDIELDAFRGDGDQESTTLRIPPNGFLQESAADLFPELGSGSGYTVIARSNGLAGLRGTWITTNRVTGSPGSGSGVVVLPGAKKAEPPCPGRTLIFTPLSQNADLLTATVVTNLGDEPADVLLRFYNPSGKLLLEDGETIRGLQPNSPRALLVPFFEGSEGIDNVSMTATSDNCLAGSTFQFDRVLGSPSIADAMYLDTFESFRTLDPAPKTETQDDP